jgi:hypothetical protein
MRIDLLLNLFDLKQAKVALSMVYWYCNTWWCMRQKHDVLTGNIGNIALLAKLGGLKLLMQH